MSEEFNWHLENRACSLVELPVGKKTLGSKWDGSIEQYKAHVVVLRNFQ